MLKDSIFIENKAEIFAGGGVFWEHQYTKITNITFINNEAAIGPDISSSGNRA